MTIGTIRVLRSSWGTIETINPDSKHYQELCEFLDKQSTEMLQLLVDAKIRWVSSLARNRVLRRKMSEV